MFFDGQLFDDIDSSVYRKKDTAASEKQCDKEVDAEDEDNA